MGKLKVHNQNLIIKHVVLVFHKYIHIQNAFFI